MRDERRTDTRHGAHGAWDIHVIADSDTRWKWGASIASRLRGPDPSAPYGVADLRVHGHLLNGRATPTDQQLVDVGAHAEVRRVGIGRLLADLADTRAEVVVLACVGGTIQALMHGLAQAWSTRESRPVVLTGYVGLLYEGLVDGLLLRAGADVLLANSAHDAREFRSVLEAVGADPDAVVRTALPFLDGAQHDPTAAGRTRPFTVTFVAQPSVPESREQRRYLLEQAVEHAHRHPQRQVVLKLRGRPGEQTTHLERHHYADLLTARGAVPGNVEVAYGAMADVLDRTDVCVTISSTAALEAIHRGIPTGVLTDLGIRESLGNHAFLHAGVYTSWPELHDGAVPKSDPAWALEHGVRDPEPFGAVQRRVTQLVDAAADLGPLHPWWQPERAAGYLPALMGRNGLTAHGTPLIGGRWTSDDPGPARQAVRRAARGLYDLGVGRIEPRIRRWAHL